jgi:2-methylisocitrate lyase-like PEP mutase family enzyme
MMDATTSQQDKAERFLALHHGPEPLLIPNPWDAGSARLLEWLGFAALATTSSGFAATELRDRGTYGYLARASQGRAAVQEAFGAPPSG